VTRYVIPEACANIAYSIVSAKRDAFHGNGHALDHRDEVNRREICECDG
jgi:hypothetical protein